MKKTKFYIILLTLINSVIYYRWVSFSVFTFGDWLFHFKQALLDQSIPSAWNSIDIFNFGFVDITIWRLPIYLMNGLFGKFGFDYNVAEKFIVFWPIIFGLSICSFLLVRHITKSNLSAFIGSIVFSFSTYFLSIDSQGHQLLPAAFVFSTFSILFYIKLFEQRKLYLAVFTGMLLFMSGAYDLRSLYITLGILFLYFIYELFINITVLRKNLFKNISLFLSPFFFYLMLSLYWILPILSTGYINQGYVLGRQIFGNEFYNLQTSLTTFFPFWTGEKTSWFTVQKVQLFFWIYSFLAVSGLILNRKNKNIIFFGLIVIIGLFFSKQSDYPFSQFYGWMYINFPGFDAFRESSKFDYMISLGFAVLIGGFIKWLLEQKFKIKYAEKYKYIFILLITILFLWNGKPIFTGEIGQLYVPLKIPLDFIKVKNYIFDQSNYFRTFWINMSLQWTMSDNLHPEIEGVVTFNNDWHRFVVNELSNRKDTEGKKIIKSLKSDPVRRLLALSSVKYLIVPLSDKETNSDIVKGFGETHDYYIGELSKISYLKNINIGTKDILVYENSNYRPHIYQTTSEESLSKDVPYEKINYSFVTPSEYIINIKNIKSPLWINFSENYHPAWEIRVGKFNWLDVLTQKNYFLQDKLHKSNVLNFNSFYIDPKVICSLYSCKQNIDGGYDIELTLYLRTQSKLYLGMIVSGVTLLISILYLIYYGAKNFKYKK